MRILFYYRGVENLGVGYVMSMLKSKGHEIDLIFDPGLDDNLYLRMPGFKWLNRYGTLIERAKGFKPDLVCMGSLTNLWPHTAQMAMRLKEEIGAPIIVGGHHAQALPEYVMAHPAVDYVCIGEGEIATLDLVTRLENGQDTTSVPTIWAKSSGSIYRNEIGPMENDLDRFPFPEKQLWYEYGCFKTNFEILTGRGCPFKCTFCNIHHQQALFKGKSDLLRKRSVANVMAEFRQNLALYDLRSVVVHDDNFTVDADYLEEFCEAYRKEVNLPWYCFGYPTTIKPRILKAMKAANCMVIFMGVDSGDPDIRRDLMGRPMSDETVFKAAEMIKAHGIGLQISLMFGLPGETPAQMWKTLSMADSIEPTQCSAYIYYPFPKTKMFDISKEMGLLDEKGEEIVKQGLSGYHHGSILKHPHREQAETMAQVAPIYAVAPEFLKPVMRWIIRHNLRGLALFLYILLFPLIFPIFGLEGMRITLRMAWKALWRIRPPQRGPARAADSANTA